MHSQVLLCHPLVLDWRNHVSSLHLVVVVAMQLHRLDPSGRDRTFHSNGSMLFWTEYLLLHANDRKEHECYTHIQGSYVQLTLEAPSPCISFEMHKLFLHCLTWYFDVAVGRFHRYIVDCCCSQLMFIIDWVLGTPSTTGTAISSRYHACTVHPSPTMVQNWTLFLHVFGEKSLPKKPLLTGPQKIYVLKARRE